MTDVKTLADNADVIVNGYAFKSEKEHVFVVNLNHPELTTVLDLNGRMRETTMADIEVGIVERMYLQNRDFFEA